MTASAERVDSHHHVWDLASRPQPWTEGLAPLERSYLFDELVPQLDAAGVAGTVVVHTVHSVDETLELLALAAEHSRVLGVVGWFDLSARDLSDQLDAARALPGGDRLVGVRHQLQLERDTEWLIRPDVRRSLALLGAENLAYDVVVSPEQLPVVVAAVDAEPATTYILDHAGKPDLVAGDLAEWRRDLAELARRESVTAKLSGLVTQADWGAWTVADLRGAVETVLEVFGPERTMWGSDWPVCRLAGAEYATWVSTTEELLDQLAPEEAAAVWAGTARRTYRLEA